MAGTPQRSLIVQWLKDAHVPFIVGRHGWPLVYRDKMLPMSATEARNEEPEFDYSRAVRHRKPAKK